MWWRSRRGRHRQAGDRASAAPAMPVVLAVTEPLTAATADVVAGQVGRLAPETPVVIDLTGIPSFDSDGAATISGLQDREGGRPVTIVGLRQAAARLTGASPAAVPP